MPMSDDLTLLFTFTEIMQKFTNYAQRDLLSASEIEMKASSAFPEWQR